MLNVFAYEYFLLFVFLLAAIDLLGPVDVFSDLVVCAICSLVTYRLYRRIKLLTGDDTASHAGLAKEFMHKVVVNCAWFFGITSGFYLMLDINNCSWDTIDLDLTVGKFLLMAAIMMLCVISIILWIHRVFWAFDKLELEDKALSDGAKNNNEITVLKQSLTRMKSDSERYLESINQQQKNKLHREAQLAFAGNVQQSALPDLEALNRELEGTGYAVKGGMNANEGIGGDMYDCRKLDDDHILIMIADVSGEGVTAAVFMMLTQTLVYSSADANTPGVIMQRTNEYLVKHNSNKLFVTMWLGIVELSTGKITYASAGHNPPVLRDAAKKAVWINEKPNLVLAAMPNRKYNEYERFIEPGGVLYLYTDGISEARDANKDFFGNDRLIESVKNARGPADVLTDVANFVDGAPQSDDMTYLWLERR